MRHAYPIEIDEAADGVTITCPDVPEMTCGATYAEAVDRAADALVTALWGYVEDGRPFPSPSAAEGRYVICVKAPEAANPALND